MGSVAGKDTRPLFFKNTYLDFRLGHFAFSSVRVWLVQRKYFCASIFSCKTSKYNKSELITIRLTRFNLRSSLITASTQIQYKFQTRIACSFYSKHHSDTDQLVWFDLQSIQMNFIDIKSFDYYMPSEWLLIVLSESWLNNLACDPPRIFSLRMLNINPVPLNRLAFFLLLWLGSWWK